VFPEPLVRSFITMEHSLPRRCQTVAALRGYGVGLIGLVAVKVLAPGFYARQDIRTPVKIAVAVLLATQVMNAMFVPWLGHAGLALSIGLGALVNAGCLLIGLRRGGLYTPSPGWGPFIARLLLATSVLAAWLGWAAGASTGSASLRGGAGGSRCSRPYSSARHCCTLRCWRCAACGRGSSCATADLH